MARYKLTLADEDGVLLEQWTLSTDIKDEEADHIVPLAKWGVQALADDINSYVEPLTEAK